MEDVVDLRRWYDPCDQRDGVHRSGSEERDDLTVVIQTVQDTMNGDVLESEQCLVDLGRTAGQTDQCDPAGDVDRLQSCLERARRAGRLDHRVVAGGWQFCRMQR